MNNEEVKEPVDGLDPAEVINEEVTSEVKGNDAPPAPKQTVLLGGIAYTSDEDFENFLNNLNLNQAIFILISNGKYSQAKGVLTLEEGELISAAIRAIKKNSKTTPTPDEVIDSAVKAATPPVPEDIDNPETEG